MSQNQRVLRNSATGNRPSLMCSLQDVLNKETLINMEELEKATVDSKVDILTQAILNVNNKFASVHQIINDPSDGLHTRLEDDSTTVQAIKEENKTLKKELEITKGILEKQSVEIDSLKSKITAINAKSMKSNITISGLPEEEDEHCIDTATQFFQDEMGLIVESHMIKKAYRIGQKKPEMKERTRMMVVTLNSDFRDTVLSNKKNLKGKKNKYDKFYSVDTQLPDQWSEQRRETREIAKKAKKANKEKKPGQPKDEIQIKDRQVFINDNIQLKPIYPPKVHELFPNKSEQDKIDKIKLYPSTQVEEDGSMFQAFTVKSQNTTEIKRAYVKVKQTFPHAQHVLMAFTSKNGEGYHDDGEHGASHKVLKTIKDHFSPALPSVAVFVVRVYEGQHIGPKRHTLIAKAVAESLTASQQKTVNPLHNN